MKHFELRIHTSNVWEPENADTGGYWEEHPGDDQSVTLARLQLPKYDSMETNWVSAAGGYMPISAPSLSNSTAARFHRAMRVLGVKPYVYSIQPGLLIAE